MMKTPLKSPFTYFGGKSAVAGIVWNRFGADIPNFIDPFMGSSSILLARPNCCSGRITYETVNDVDAFIANAYRAIKHDPTCVAMHADYPTFENDLHARHIWLVNRSAGLKSKIEGSPDFYDAKIAGWWLWGMALWIGGGFCSGAGSWVVENGELVKRSSFNDENTIGIAHSLPYLKSRSGVHRKMPRDGRGIKSASRADLQNYLMEIADRFVNVRVMCGDWKRVLSDSATIHCASPCGVFLDPPYGKLANRTSNIYSHDSLNIADEARLWALEHGNDPRYRIALCGYLEEHDREIPDNWERYSWIANGGFSNQRKKSENQNRKRECIWFSPHCLKPNAELNLFEEEIMYEIE